MRRTSSRKSADDAPPRCQRTFRALGPPGSDTIWTCPHCPDAETYEVVRDPDLLAFAADARHAVDRGFGPPRHDRGFGERLVLGLHPECVREQRGRRYDLYLARGSGPSQLRLQIGEEMFHRVCSEGRVFHWTHEMLACLFTLSLLREHGLGGYADRVEHDWRRDAVRMPPETLAALDLWAAAGPYPPGLYGRAFVVGDAFRRAVGWDALRPLARSLGPNGQPDVAAWLGTLAPSEREHARSILAGVFG
jgi:hypothetical protein